MTSAIIILTFITLIVAPLVVLGISGWIRSIWQNRKDRIDISGELHTTCSLEILKFIGCPCLVLTVKNLTNRIAKIKTAYISCIISVEKIKEFERRFGEDFGYVPDRDNGSLRLELHPITQQTFSQGWVLERDDVCCFVLPCMTPLLKSFYESRSEDLSMEIQFFDGLEFEIMRGIELLSSIRTLVEINLDASYSLKIKPLLCIQVESKTKPNLNLVGKTNVSAINI